MSTARKVAIVTGAAQGIGRSIALRLAKDGFNVVVADRAVSDDKSKAVAAECEKLGAKAAVIPADVRSEEEVYGLVEKAAQQLGSVDGE